MKTLLTAAAIALGAAVAAPASAAPGSLAAQSAVELAPGASGHAAIEQARYYYQYGTIRRGRCVLRYIYVTNGYRYAYRWKRRCR